MSSPTEMTGVVPVMKAAIRNNFICRDLLCLVDCRKILHAQFQDIPRRNMKNRVPQMEHERQSFTWLHANIENAEVHGLLLLHACSGGLNSGLDVLTMRLLFADNCQNTDCKTDFV